MQSAINIEKPMAARRSVGSVGQKKVKTFTDEQNERIRKAVARLVEDMGTRTAVAHLLGVDQPQISQLLNENAGAGFPLAATLARHLGVSIEQLVDGRAAPARGGAGAIRYGDLPGWAQASAEARRAHGQRLPAVAFDLADDFMGMGPPTVIDARTVFNYARACWEGLNDEQQNAAMAAQARAEMAAEDAEALELLRRGKLRDESAEPSSDDVSGTRPAFRAVPSEPKKVTSRRKT